MKLVQKSVSVILSLAMLLSLTTGLSFSASAEVEGFVHSEGTHFILNGNTFYVTGCNSYDLHRIGTWEVDKLMQEMQDNGVNVCRTWAFSTDWYCGFESYSNGKWNYHEDRFRQLDYIMNSAKQHGIRMILTLENYWEGFGGIDKKLEALGMDSETHQARSKWYTNETCKNWYKAYAEHLINRTNTYTGVKYKDDPTLFAWGLMNEARFQDSGEDYSSTTLRRWVDEMGAYVKSLDPNHMVSIELEGHGQKYGFGNDEGNNFVYVQQSPYVDYCSVHIYPDEEWCDMSVDTTANIMNMLINDAHNAVGKPIIVGEFNGSRTNPKLIDYWKAVFGTLYNKDAAGALFWNYSTNYIDKHTVMKGDYILDYFKEMSQKYAAKSMHISDDSDNSDESDDDTKTNTKVIECEAYANAKYANKAGVTTASSLGGYTGTGYASLNGTNTLYIPFTAPKAGTYTFAVSYARPQGKSADIYIDRYDNYSGASYNTFTVDGTKYYQNAYQQVGSGSSSQWSTKTVSYSFGAGETKLIGLTDNNAVAYFDKITVTATKNVFDKEDTESSIADSSSVAESSEIESSSVTDSSSEIVEESSSEADNVVKTNTKTIECEDYANASYTNSGNVTTATSLNGYTGTGFASLNGAKTLFVPFTAPKAGTYTFTVSYAKPQNGNADIYFDRFDNYSGASYSTFTVDGVTYYQNAYQQVGSGSSSQWSTFTVTHQFNAGETKLIGLTDNNKVAYFDKIVVTAPEAVFVTQTNEDSSEVVEDSSSEIVEDSSSVAESSEDDSSSEVIEESSSDVDSSSEVIEESSSDVDSSSEIVEESSEVVEESSIADDSSEVIPDTNEQVIWQGNVSITSWSQNGETGVANIPGAVKDGVVTVYCTALNSGAQFQLSGNKENWNWFDIRDANDQAFSVNGDKIQFSLTDETANILANSKSLVLKGNNINVTKITYSAPNSNPVESSSVIVEESSEAEDDTKTNTKVIECEDYANASYTNSGNVTTGTSLNGYTGTGFASLNGAKTLFVPFTAPKAGTYTFTVSYAKPQNNNADIYFDRFDNYSGASYSTFAVDGVTYYQNAYQQVGSGSSSQWSTFTVTHTFNAGETKLIGLTDNNKVAYFDKVVVTAPSKVF